MKKLYFLLCLLLVFCGVFAQTRPGMPPFRILRTDSTIVTPADIKKGRPVMIIYFSPDCSHCQHLMKEMKPEMKKFGDTQIIMITYIQPAMLKEIRDFSHEFGLNRNPNIIIGTEGYTLLVQRYYQIAITPFIAIYNREGSFVKSFATPPDMSELVTTIIRT